MNSVKIPLAVGGRLLLALMFVMSGFGKLTDLAGTSGYIASSGLPVPGLFAFGAGVLELVAGIALVVGFKARWAALALGAFTLLASVLFHAFWAAPPAQAYVQQLMFMKNLAVAGGMFLVAALGAGPLSIDHRRTAAA